MWEDGTVVDAGVAEISDGWGGGVTVHQVGGCGTEAGRVDGEEEE